MGYSTARMFSDHIPERSDLEGFYRSSKKTIRAFRKKQLIRVLMPLHHNN